MSTMDLRPDSRGKVRDIYDAGDNLLMVATDRISAFDFILPDEIPFKGEVLNRISKFWFDKFSDILPNHMAVSYTHLDVYKRQVLAWRFHQDRRPQHGRYGLLCLGDNLAEL